MLYLLILVALLIFLVDSVPLIRQKQWAELTVAAAIAAAALLLFAGWNAGMTTPVKLLNRLFESFGKNLFG